MREAVYQIMLRALKDTKSGHKKGDEVLMINSIFDRNNGVAFFEIGLEWEIVWQRQFTGKYYKNGEKVFEGDLVDGVGTCLHKIEWNDKGALFVCTNIIPNDYAYKGRALMFMDVEFPNMKYAGNIHQHKYLLDV